jgi:hypothetical protein
MGDYPRGTKTLEKIVFLREATRTSNLFERTQCGWIVFTKNPDGGPVRLSDLIVVSVVRVKFRRAAEEMISLISPPFRICEISGVHLNVSSKFALRVDCERTTRRSAEYKHKQRKK